MYPIQRISAAAIIALVAGCASSKSATNPVSDYIPNGQPGSIPHELMLPNKNPVYIVRVS